MCRVESSVPASEQMIQQPIPKLVRSFRHFDLLRAAAAAASGDDDACR